jgi:mRNA-degrading endonuclease RelE of RelBE toxin-antitoxin system
MNSIQIEWMPVFKKAYKKLHKNAKICVDDAIENIVKNPKIGEEKAGDLRNFFVYKFKINSQEYLISYQWDAESRTLYTLGVHENFYRELKKYIL